MARTREPEIEFDPRHRIVGAIVLVTLAVILLPLILDENPNPAIASATNVDQASSAQPDGAGTAQAEKVIVKKLTLNEGAPATKSSSSQSGSKPVERETTGGQTRVVTKKVELGSVKPAASKVDSKPVKVTASASKQVVTKPHWAVQVGTFSNQSNVRRLKKQLEQHGFSVMFKDIKLKQGNAVRVRVGPYSSRASADKAQGRIRQDIGIKGVVVAGP
ncbi:MAG: SPOR domain-containing protein [Acidiferrobacterales bacterium]